VSQFEVLPWNFKGKTEEKTKTHGHDSRSSGRGSKPVHREYETWSRRRYLVQQCATETARQTDRQTNGKKELVEPLTAQWWSTVQPMSSRSITMLSSPLNHNSLYIVPARSQN